MNQELFNRSSLESVTSLKFQMAEAQKEIEKHEHILEGVKEKITVLVVEVKQIRNALYFVAAAIAASAPGLKELVSNLKLFFFN